jgi:hypothetical protein
MKRGGQVVYTGPLGHHSHLMVEYFESIPGVPKIQEGYNPATWMLDISTPAMEAQLNVDFAEIYANSDLYRYPILQNFRSQLNFVVLFLV